MTACALPPQRVETPQSAVRAPGGDNRQQDQSPRSASDRAGLHERGNPHRASAHGARTAERPGSARSSRGEAQTQCFHGTNAPALVWRDRQTLVRAMLRSGEWNRNKPGARLRWMPRGGLPKSIWRMFPVPLPSRQPSLSPPFHSPGRRDEIAFWYSLTGFAPVGSVPGNGS